MSLIVVASFFLAALAALLVRTAAVRAASRSGGASAPSADSRQAAAPALEDGTLDRFRAALRIATVWPEAAEGADPASAEAAEAERPLVAFQDFLVASYPAFHAAAERTVLSPYCVLYRWPGTDASAAPALLLAHYDVVPAEAEAWTVPPFAAELKDGFVWARGALDTKISLIGAMEGAEALAARGFRPRRDLWFAFGGDEERSGVLGALRASAWFRERGVRFSWCLDEGSVISDGILKGADRPLALVGIEEKGFLDIELTVEQGPGHASRPPKVQAAAVLGRALDRLSRRPFPWGLTPATEAFFRGFAARAPFGPAVAMANARLLGPAFFAAAGSSADSAALLRTTLAMTQLSGSPADNVLPSRVKAILNLRLLPPWTVEAAVGFVRRAVADDRVRVAVSPLRAANDPLPASKAAADGSADGWADLRAALAACCPEAAVLPFLVTATTDSRHYAPLCDSVFRFAPLRLGPKDLAGIHGHDERVSVGNVALCAAFYERLLEAQ